MNEGSVVIPLDCDHQYSIRFQTAEDLLCLAQMRRFHRRPVEEVAGNQKNVRPLFNRFLRHITEGRSKVGVR